MDYVVQYYKAFYEQNINIDIIHCDSDFSKYKVVLSPLMYMVKEGMDEKLKAYVKNGGRFVTTVFSGIVDENDLVHLGGYPGKLRELLGIWVEEVDALPADKRNSIVMANGTVPLSEVMANSGKPPSEEGGARRAGVGFDSEYPCRMLCDIIHPEGAEVLATYGSDFYKGIPCVTKNTYGQGAAYYVGTFPDDSFVTHLAQNILAEVGISPEISPVAGVEITKREKDGVEFNFILNHNTDSTATVDIGADTYYDILSGEHYTGEVEMQPRDVLVLKKKPDYAEIKNYLTPHKYGKPIFSGSGVDGTYNKHGVDCPFVFRHNNKFYMLHVGFDGIGYQTALATSNDLLDWQELAVVLTRDNNKNWDSVGAGGTWILKEDDSIHAVPTLKKVDGKYWMVYHSYPDEGYEAGPAQIGLAWCEDEDLLTWHKLEKPIFSYKDGAEWERGGLYKACILEKDGTYYMYYNAKNNKPHSWHEQIGMATSKDMLNWTRHEGNPIVPTVPDTWDAWFVADPYVVHDGNKWVMYYYGFNRKTAQEGIAYSYDMFNWTKYDEPIISSGKGYNRNITHPFEIAEHELDTQFAHKPSVLKWNGILYHFYVASRIYREGDKGKGLWNDFRSVTVATSKSL